GATRDRNGRIENRDTRDDIDARRREDRARYNSEGERLSFENLPGQVKQTVGQEMGQDIRDLVLPHLLANRLLHLAGQILKAQPFSFAVIPGPVFTPPRVDVIARIAIFDAAVAVAGCS